MDGGQWYPQVVGVEDGEGTGKLAGREARFFMNGRSEHFIRFNRLSPWRPVQRRRVRRTPALPEASTASERDDHATLATSSFLMSSIPYRSMASRSSPYPTPIAVWRFGSPPR
jgi:hypothetical protein